jgi:hypothetical protein
MSTELHRGQVRILTRGSRAWKHSLDFFRRQITVQRAKREPGPSVAHYAYQSSLSIYSSIFPIESSGRHTARANRVDLAFLVDHYVWITDRSAPRHASLLHTLNRAPNLSDRHPEPASGLGEVCRCGHASERCRHPKSRRGLLSPLYVSQYRDYSAWVGHELAEDPNVVLLGNE